MSLELFLLLAVVILLPLLQQLLQAARQRAETLTPPAQQAPAAEPPRAALAIPPMPETADDEVSEVLAARGPSAVRKIASRVTLSPTLHPARRRPGMVAGLRNRLTIRDGIVLMAVLGPCRAVNQYEWPDGVRRTER